MMSRGLFDVNAQPAPRELRPYQIEGLDALRASIRQGVRRIILQLPTGAGKTRLSAEIATQALRKGNRVSFVVPRISLVDQTVAEFAKEGITQIGVMQSSHELTDCSQPVQICSIDTVRRRKFPDSHVVIFDEAHMWRETHAEWMAERPDAVFIGLSATPWSKGLGEHFESLLIVATMRQLMDDGYLCRYRAFGPGNPDLTGIKTIGGDYHEGQLSERLRNDDALIGDIVRTWQRLHGKDRTLLFAVDCAHAKILQERFIQSGVPCGYQDAHTPEDERAAIKQQFHAGKLPIVASVGTMIVGVDYDVRCISFCRPTKSESLFVQAFGRGLRLAAPGGDQKDHLVFLDHSGTIARLGYPDEILYDRLHDGHVEPKAIRKPALPKPCPSCAYMFRGKVCPNCGQVKEMKLCAPVETDDELVEITSGVARAKGLRREYSIAEKSCFYAELKALAGESGKKPGWAAHNYKAKFGAWPHHSISDIPPATAVSVATRNWVLHRNIIWAKQQRKGWIR